MSTPVVLLDTNVLAPQRLASLLLTLAEHDLFEPRWSEEILAELDRTLITKLGVDPGKAEQRLAIMRRAFPRGVVVGHEGIVGDPRCDPKDQHVYAAAQCASADLLVTFNLDDFPIEVPRSGDVPVHHPDDFLLSLWSENRQAMKAAIEYEVRRMRRPPMEVRGLLAGFASIIPKSADTLLRQWS